MAENILLSPPELAKLRAICAPDFFAELGSAPVNMNRIRNCGRTIEAVRSVRVTVKFPTEFSARKWNAFQETQIRMTGHIATATVAVLVGTLTTPAAGIGVGTLAGIAKDEIQARIWYPKVSRGWTLLREYEIHYQQFPHVRFYTLATDTLIDHQAAVVERHFHGRIEVPLGQESSIPEAKLSWLFNAAPAERTLIYQ